MQIVCKLLKLLIFQVFNLADRHLVGNSFLSFQLIELLYIFTALYPTPYLYMGAYGKARSKTGIPAPADARNIVRFAI